MRTSGLDENSQTQRVPIGEHCGGRGQENSKSSKETLGRREGLDLN